MALDTNERMSRLVKKAFSSLSTIHDSQRATRDALGVTSGIGFTKALIREIPRMAVASGIKWTQHEMTQRRGISGE
jgi:hypothetical protein